MRERQNAAPFGAAFFAIDSIRPNANHYKMAKVSCFIPRGLVTREDFVTGAFTISSLHRWVKETLVNERKPGRQFSIPTHKSHKGLIVVLLLVVAAIAVGYFNNWFGLI